jgi:hypothetical protein
MLAWCTAPAALHLCMASCGGCISRRAPKLSRFSSCAGSSKHWGFACFDLVPIHARGGGRITGFDLPLVAELPKKKKPNCFDNYSGFADSQALSVQGVS